MKKLAAFFAFAVTAGVAASLLFGAGQAFAFDQNQIIDDPIFDEVGSMSITSINSFLNSFPSSCISPNNGFSAPDPVGYNPTNGFQYAGNVTAGEVIYDAANAYGISPQVLLTTLQKEQSLVSGTAGCSVQRYTAATGYGCPDSGTTHDYSGLNLYTINGTTVTSVTGTCVNTAIKAGFSQQVIRAAWLLKFGEQRSEGNVNWAVIKTTPEGSWDNSDDPQSCYGGPMTQGTWKTCPSSQAVYYDGYTTIDGTAVHMNNGATAALYWYTPHFSGNQSFSTIFTNWFGATLVSGYNWTPTWQAAYTDNTTTTRIDPNSLTPGQRFYVLIAARNDGMISWQKGVANRQVNLGTSHPQDRASAFCDSSWLNNTGCNRAATTNETQVDPGGQGTFGFWMTAPTTPGTYNEYFNLVMDGTSWLQDRGLYWTFRVNPFTPAWQPVQQSLYTDNNMTTPLDPNSFLPGQRAYLLLKAKNTGNVAWQKGVYGRQVNVGTTHWLDRGSWFCDSTWLNPPTCNRPATTSESVVDIGQVGTFGFWITAPPAGTYNEYFNLVMDGTRWAVNDPGLYWTLKVNPVLPAWQPVSQAMYTDNTMATPQNPLTLAPSTRYYLVITAKNTGNVTWQKGTAGRQMNVGTAHPNDRTSGFCDSTWLNTFCNRPATTTEASVDPGQNGTFGFWVTTPSTPGTYNEYFNLVMDGTRWAVNDPGLYWTLKVN